MCGVIGRLKKSLPGPAILIISSVIIFSFIFDSLFTSESFDSGSSSAVTFVQSFSIGEYGNKAIKSLSSTVYVIFKTLPLKISEDAFLSGINNEITNLIYLIRFRKKRKLKKFKALLKM